VKPADTRPEPWSWGAFGITAAIVATTLFLGARPGGELPVRVYLLGPTVLGLVAALWLVVGVLLAVRRPPTFQRRRLAAFLALAAGFWWCSFPLAYPSSFEGHPSRTALRLPFEGRWRVRWGGESREENAYVLQPARRFAVHFEPLDGERTVLAPAPGEVLALAPVEGAPARARLELRLAGGEVLVLETAAPLAAAVGEALLPGRVLGQADDFGVALHLQDGAKNAFREGIPMRFEGYTADGKPVRRGAPRRGEVLETDPAGR